MDTLDLYTGNIKTTTALVTDLTILGAFIIFLPLFFNPPILANDTRIVHATTPTITIDKPQIYNNIMNEISPEVRKQNFDKQIKEKYKNSSIRTITDGVKHVKMVRYYDGKPVRINLVEIDRKLAADFEIKPALSSTSSNLHSRRTITTIAKNTDSIVALNGTFFKPQTGVPLGTLMIDGKLYTGPVFDRVAMGITDTGFEMGRIQMNSFFKVGNKTIKIDNINQPRMLSTHILAYTNEWGKTAPASPKYGMQIAIKDGEIVKVSANPLSIPENGYVIVGPQNILKEVYGEKTIEVSLGTTPEWKKVKHIISGGPYLVKDGETFVDMTAQKLGSIGGKNPRSAIGYTADGNLIMVAVDGREGSSVGMTLMQLANFMKKAGCINAMNLDGGGSTVMYVNGQVVNNPAFKGGIAISNALVLSKKTSN